MLAEIQLIKTHRTLAPNGYNLTPGGDGALGMTSYVKDKIRKSKLGVPVFKARGKKISHELRQKISKNMGSFPVEAKNLETGICFTIDFVNDGKRFGFNPSLISAVIKGKRTHHKNHTFKFINHANTEGDLSNT